MTLPFFSRHFVLRLREEARNNVAKYGGETGWLTTFAGTEQCIYLSAQVVGPPPILVMETSANPEHDADNAILVYRWLEQLSPSVAMQERLWSYMTHWPFAEYMASRWPVDSETDVKRRYLLEGPTFAALARNGISRLWWAAYLTREVGRVDEFELTRVLFSRQDIQVSLLERSLGKCRHVRVAVLEFLRTHQEWFGAQNFGRRIQLLLKEINLEGGVTLLDAMPPDALAELLKRRAEKIVREAA